MSTTSGAPQQEPLRPIRIGQSSSVAFSPDGTLLCVGGRSVSLWSVPERRKLWRAHPLSHPSSLAFTNDAERIVVKNTSGLIVQVQASDGDLATDFHTRVSGEGSNVLVAPSGEVLVDGSWNGLVTFRSTSSGDVRAEYEFSEEMVTSLHHGPSGFFSRQNLKGPHGGITRVLQWSWEGEHEAVAWVEAALQRRWEDFAVVPDGSRCMFEARSTKGGEDRSLAVEAFDMTSGASLWTADMGDVVYAQDVQWSHRGHLAATSAGGQVALRDGGSGEVLATWAIDYPGDLAFAPDDRLLAMGSFSSGGLLVDVSEYLNG